MQKQVMFTCVHYLIAKMSVSNQDKLYTVDLTAYLSFLNTEKGIWVSNLHK